MVTTKEKKRDVFKKNKYWILLAHGFNANIVTRVTTSGRMAGHSLTLIGLTAGQQRSDMGIYVTPDRILEEVSAGESTVIFFPGGVSSAQSLISDPRVHRLCAMVQENRGQVIADSTVREIIQNGGIRLTAPSDWVLPPWLMEILIGQE